MTLRSHINTDFTFTQRKRIKYKKHSHAKIVRAELQKMVQGELIRPS